MRKKEDLIDPETGDFRNLADALEYYGETWYQNLGPGFPDPSAYGPGEQDLFVKHCSQVDQDQRQTANVANAMRQVFPPQSPLPDFDFVAATGAETVEERKRGEGNLLLKGEAKRLRDKAEKTLDPSEKARLLQIAGFTCEDGYREARQNKPYSFETKLAETQFSNAKKELEALADDPQQKAKIKENSLYFQSLVRGVNQQLNEEFSFFMGKDPQDGNFVITRIGHGEKAAEISKRPGGEEWLAAQFKYQYPDSPPAGMEKKVKEATPVNPDDPFSVYEKPQKAYEEFKATGNMPKEGLRPEPKVSQPDWEESLRPVE